MKLAELLPVGVEFHFVSLLHEGMQQLSGIIVSSMNEAISNGLTLWEPEEFSPGESACKFPSRWLLCSPLVISHAGTGESRQKSICWGDGLSPETAAEAREGFAQCAKYGSCAWGREG